MTKFNGAFSYYFSGTPSVLSDYFQARSAAYNRYIREKNQDKNIANSKNQNIVK